MSKPTRTCCACGETAGPMVRFIAPALPALDEFIAPDSPALNEPAVFIDFCQRCHQTTKTGTPLAKESLLLRTLEREFRQWNRQMVRSQPGLTRNQRRRLLRRLDADIAQNLDQAQTGLASLLAQRP